ncbi:MAG: hypothetical protein JXR91_17415 [Deltaproteobacteria bacterium]|nr:hypothetical protein [Deltaproteobacteria bacterium]
MTSLKFLQQTGAKILNRISNIAVVCFSVAIMIQSVISPLHLAFAHHKHHFDPETGFFEDVIESNKGDDVTGLFFKPDKKTIKKGVRYKAVFSGCPFSNHFGSRYIAVSILNTNLRYSIFNHKNDLINSQLYIQKALFFTAPKHSPPTIISSHL